MSLSLRSGYQVLQEFFSAAKVFHELREVASLKGHVLLKKLTDATDSKVYARLELSSWGINLTPFSLLKKNSTYILNEKRGPKEDACIMSYQSQGVSVWEGAEVVHLQAEYSSRSSKIFSRILYCMSIIFFLLVGNVVTNSRVTPSWREITELSAEQAFWSQNSGNSKEPNLSTSTTIVKVPKELPKVSMAVEQHCVEKNIFQDKMKDVLKENERLLEQAISTDIVNIVHVLIRQNMVYYLLVEKMYLFTNNILHQLWKDVRLQVNYEVNMAYDLLRLIRRQINEGYKPEQSVWIHPLDEDKDLIKKLEDLEGEHQV
nr:hypothetical protein [Tanacetum cinerariifolium]